MRQPSQFVSKLDKQYKSESSPKTNRGLLCDREMVRKNAHNRGQLAYDRSTRNEPETKDIENSWTHPPKNFRRTILLLAFVLSSTVVAPTQAASIYNDRFGGWRKSLEEFVATVDQEQAQLLQYEVEIKSSSSRKIRKRDPSLALRFFVLKRDRFCCVSCGRSPANTAGLVLEIDHRVAWVNGGETIEENLQTLCFDCNRGKGASV